MRKASMALIAAAATLAGCAGTGYGGGYGNRYAGGPDYRAYDYNRPDPAYNGYYADRYYRDGPNYREHRLGANDRVYRGQDGRYYCRRNDGTTGLLVGGGAGALLGAAIAPGGSGLLGAVLGGAGGALAGRAVERSNDPVSCR